MTIHVKLKSSGATGTAYNLNGADPERIDWLPDGSATSGLRSDPMGDFLVQLDGDWIDLAQAITFGQVKVNESNGGLTYV